MIFYVLLYLRQWCSSQELCARCYFPIVELFLD